MRGAIQAFASRNEVERDAISDFAFSEMTKAHGVLTKAANVNLPQYSKHKI